jgi:hypothetical protein
VPFLSQWKHDEVAKEIYHCFASLQATFLTMINIKTYKLQTDYDVYKRYCISEYIFLDLIHSIP